jgi:DNA-binding MarR family transcriptional regulator
MQISHDANNRGNSQQTSYAGQAAQVIEELREILAKVSPPPPDEVLSLISRLEGAEAKDKPYLIPKHVAFHRMRNILHRKPGSTMGELSQALSVPLYSVTRMVDWLVATGLADRLSDPADRRVVRVTLTDDGQRLHQAIEARVTQSIHRIMACLTPEEQGILITLLRKVTASLKESET